MSQGIKIRQVTGGSPVQQDDLKGCRFKTTGTSGQYLFYDKNDDEITTDPSPLTTGTDFSFTLDSINWSVTEFQISGNDDNGSASGSWSTPPEEDEGSFQAQAGAGLDEEASASSGAAY